jgi:hypothetical protein
MRRPVRAASRCRATPCARRPFTHHEQENSKAVRKTPGDDCTWAPATGEFGAKDRKSYKGNRMDAIYHNGHGEFGAKDRKSYKHQLYPDCRCGEL